MNMSNMSAFRTVPQQEFKAALELTDAGHTAFVPTEYRYRRTGASRTRRTKIKVPMFPGYVFGSGKPSEARYTRKRVGTLRRDEFGHLQDISGREIDNEPKVQPWKAGDDAVVSYGPFAGTAVKVVEVHKRFVLVSMLMFGTVRETGLYPKQIKRPG